jgi:hypothetical protein
VPSLREADECGEQDGEVAGGEGADARLAGEARSAVGGGDERGHYVLQNDGTSQPRGGNVSGQRVRLLNSTQQLTPGVSQQARR